MTKIDVVSGFLGAGKTTLIKKLLKEALDGSKTVLIENEFGEIGIDGGFLKESGIEIKEMNTPSAYLWAPSIKTAFGGVPVYSGVHVWMADSQTKAARAQWMQALDGMLALKPERVIPGHFLGTEPKGTQAVTFTRDYVQRFEQALASAQHSDQLIDGLKKAFPSLPVDDGLAIGAKVNMGEMKW